MFSLNYKDHNYLKKTHKDWCLQNVPLPDENPEIGNFFLDWLYQNKDDMFTLTPENMLEKLDTLLEVLIEQVTDNVATFTLLFKNNFLFWERNSTTNIMSFVFSWPDSADFDSLRQLMSKKSSQKVNDSLVAQLKNLDMLDDIIDIVSATKGDTLFQRVKKHFQYDGYIKLPMASFINNEHFDAFESFCTNSFDYKKYSRQRGSWGPYPQIELLENTVCPYCNRSYTNSVFEEKVHGGRPELDHFLSKSVFPFFALAIYNLIPVCHSCNHAKLDKHVIKLVNGSAQFTHLHPNLVDDNVDKIRVFKTELDGDLISFLMKNDFSLKGKIQITDECKATTKVKNSLEIYRLAFEWQQNELVGYYTDHYKDIERTLNLVKQYPVSALDSIAKLIDEDTDTLKRVFIENLISEKPWDEPLGKLRNDLLGSIISSLQVNNK